MAFNPQIGDRVRVKGRGNSVFVLVDFDHQNGKARVAMLARDPQTRQLTNHNPEWISKSKLQEYFVTYTWVKYFSSYTKVKEFFADKEDGLSSLCNSLNADEDKKMRKAIELKHEAYFPIPNSAPSSFEEMKEKSAFNEVQMEYYRRFKKEFMDDFIREITFKSLAEVEQDKFVYNDRQLGEFDFAKASVGLNKRFEYYSVKHEQVVPMSDVDILPDGKGGFKYQLKMDGSEVIIREELDSQGRPKYFSTVKKSYLMKEKVPREKNAVRIFLYQGGSGRVGGDGILYPAMTAIALTEILEQIGYSVSFIAGWDASQRLNARGASSGFESDETKVRTGIYNPRKRGWEQGERYIMYSIKNFNENLNVPELLYLTADPALYLWEAFRYMHMLLDISGDKYVNVGYLGSVDNWEQAVYSSFMPKDVNKGVIYITIKGISSIDAVRNRIKDTIKYVEEVNRAAREELRQV